MTEGLESTFRLLCPAVRPPSIADGEALAAAAAAVADWDAVVVAARRHRVLRPGIATALLGTPGPAPDPRTVRRTRRFVARFYAGGRWRDGSRRGTQPWLRRNAWCRLYAYRLKPGWRHFRDELVADLGNPVDRDVLRLPDWLDPLYPPLRPLGWVLRNLRRRGKR